MTYVDPQFGTRLKMAMLRNGVSPKKLADALRISDAMISRLKNGERMPSRQSVQQIAKLLSVDPAWLLWGGSRWQVVDNESVATYIFDVLQSQERCDDDQAIRLLSLTPTARVLDERFTRGLLDALMAQCRDDDKLAAARNELAQLTIYREMRGHFLNSNSKSPKIIDMLPKSSFNDLLARRQPFNTIDTDDIMEFLKGLTQAKVKGYELRLIDVKDYNEVNGALVQGNSVTAAVGNIMAVRRLGGSQIIEWSLCEKLVGQQNRALDKAMKVARPANLNQYREAFDLVHSKYRKGAFELYNWPREMDAILAARHLS